MLSTLKPLDQWPELLCGPMLRRVDNDSVAVFVALKQPYEVQLLVHESTSTGSSSVEPSSPLRFGSALVPTVPLGKCLHVLVVEARADDTSKYLQANHHYGYSLQFTANGATYALGSEGFGSLIGDRHLGYGEGRLPGFELPGTLEELNVFHGSCRKAHGEGPDMLPSLDDFLRLYHEPDPASTVEQRRPHQLILTGDQIYADDVSVCFLRTLMETAKELLGWSIPEQMGSPIVQPDHESVRPGIKRGDFVLEHTGFSSEEVDGHLLFLGEFLTMYLMSWSDALWPEGQYGGAFMPKLPEVGDVLMADDYLGEPNEFVLQLCTLELLKKLERGRKTTMTTFEGAREQLELVEVMAQTLPQVRRVLANVPTWMILDDHEITDDWFMNREWSERLRNAPVGHQVIRNGLAAYAVFQDWGNCPKKYQAGPGRKLLDNIRCGTSTDPAVYVSPPLLNELSSLFGLTSEDDTQEANTESDKPISWHWDVTWEWGTLKWRIICLDTRTRRDFPDGFFVSKKAAPALLSPEAMTEQVELKRCDNWNGSHEATNEQVDPETCDNWSGVVAIVSPAPVIGVSWHEMFQRSFEYVALGVEKLSFSGTEFADNESWSANPDAYMRMLRALARFKRVIILSGDVHYGFSNETAFFAKAGAAQTPARVVQLCSSPLHNEGGAPTLLESVVDAIGFAGSPEELLNFGWLAFDNPPGGPLPALKQLLLAANELERYLRLRVDSGGEAVFLMPNGPWPGSSFAIVVNSALSANWRFNTRFLVNPDRNDAEYTALRPVIGAELSGTTQNIDGKVDKIFEEHKSIVSANHIAALRFLPNELIEHRLFWYPRDNERVLRVPMFTCYRASLAPPSPGDEPEVSG